MDKSLLKENRLHGDAMLPIEIYHMHVHSGETVLPCHWHNEMEFLVVTEGKAVFQIETQYFEVTAGQAVFMNSGELHAGFACEQMPCSFYAIVFDPIILCSRTYDTLQMKFIDPFIKNQFSVQRHIQGNLPWERELLASLEDIKGTFQTRAPAYELVIKAQLYLLLSKLVANAAKTPHKENLAEQYKLDRLKTVLSYIHLHYHEKLNIRDLASLINMSEGHFCRFFKQMTRRTPINYINYYRVSKAAVLLEQSDKKVLDIALDVGFHNFSYFINIFHGFMNCTPSEYRRTGAVV